MVTRNAAKTLFFGRSPVYLSPSLFNSKANCSEAFQRLTLSQNFTLREVKLSYMNFNFYHQCSPLSNRMEVYRGLTFGKIFMIEGVTIEGRCKQKRLSKNAKKDVFGYFLYFL